MWLITLRDLQWRRRRFAIAIAGTALVFAMALVIAGIAASFRAEAGRTVNAIGADAWIMSTTVQGPFTSLATIAESTGSELKSDPDVQQADPLVLLRQTIRTGATPKDANVIGYRLGGLGAPPIARGRLPQTTGEVAIDEIAGVEPGKTVVIGDRDFTVVGVTQGLHFFAGLAAAYIPLDDAQALAFGGQDVATVFVTKGVPRTVPAGLKIASNEEARRDLLRPLESAIQTIDLCQILLWLVAAAIIGSIVYLSALERVRDFAVLKATGASSRALYAGLAIQSVVVSLLAGALAIGISRLLAPTFPLAVETPARSYILLPGVALVVGLVASLVGLRRTIAVDPALAFGAP